MTNRTWIYSLRAHDETRIGYLEPHADAVDPKADAVIYRLHRQDGVPIGRTDAAGRVFRRTRHDEREVGTFGADGTVRSHGLFEGGELGWVEPEGIVVRGGLIFQEEEVGRVEGPCIHAAGAALLLIFLPEADEENRQAARK